jgi:hypothetical protein
VREALAKIFLNDLYEKKESLQTWKFLV